MIDIRVRVIRVRVTATVREHAAKMEIGERL